MVNLARKQAAMTSTPSNMGQAAEKTEVWPGTIGVGNTVITKTDGLNFGRTRNSLRSNSRTPSPQNDYTGGDTGWYRRILGAYRKSSSLSLRS